MNQNNDRIKEALTRTAKLYLESSDLDTVTADRRDWCTLAAYARGTEKKGDKQ